MSGILTGLAVYVVVLIALTNLDGLVVPPARSEGKGGHTVEVLWMLMAWLPCACLGAAWAVYIGPKLDKRTRSDGNASPK